MKQQSLDLEKIVKWMMCKKRGRILVGSPSFLTHSSSRLSLEHLAAILDDDATIAVAHLLALQVVGIAVPAVVLSVACVNVLTAQDFCRKLHDDDLDAVVLQWQVLEGSASC